MPIDFQVVERNALRSSLRADDSRGPYLAFELTAVGVSTEQAIHRIASSISLKPGKIAYAGKKDRHAETRQLITVPRHDLEEAPVSFADESQVKLRLLGSVDRAVMPTDIEGNDFRIRLRNLTPEAVNHMENQLQIPAAWCFPNYFDDQRFRSHDRDLGFAVAHLFKGDLDVALLALATAIPPGLPSHERYRRLALREAIQEKRNRPDNASLRGPERRMMEALCRKEPVGDVVREWPRTDLRMSASALQSAMWNQLLREKVEASGCQMFDVRGRVAPYLFWQNDCPFEVPRTLATVGKGMSDEIVNEYRSIAQHYGIKVEDLKRPYLGRESLDSFDRATIGEADNLFCSQPESDDRYTNRKSLVLAFRLSRGAYATMFIKRLMRS